MEAAIAAVNFETCADEYKVLKKLEDMKREYDLQLKKLEDMKKKLEIIKKKPVTLLNFMIAVRYEHSSIAVLQNVVKLNMLSHVHS